MAVGAAGLDCMPATGAACVPCGADAEAIVEVATAIVSVATVAAGSTAVRGSTGGFWVRSSAAPIASTATPSTATAAQSDLLVVGAALVGMFIGFPGWS